jgi:hypothetical protein
MGERILRPLPRAGPAGRSSRGPGILIGALSLPSEGNGRHQSRRHSEDSVPRKEGDRETRSLAGPTTLVVWCDFSETYKPMARLE